MSIIVSFSSFISKPGWWPNTLSTHWLCKPSYLSPLPVLHSHVSSRKLEGIQRVNSRSTHFVGEETEARRCQWQNLEFPVIIPCSIHLKVNCALLTAFLTSTCHYGPLGLKWVFFDSSFSSGLPFHIRISLTCLSSLSCPMTQGFFFLQLYYYNRLLNGFIVSLQFPPLIQSQPSRTILI